MANDGRSADKQLIKNLIRVGIPHVRMHVDDHPVATLLKHHVNNWLTLWFDWTKTHSTSEKNIISKRLTKIEVKMNQLRQKHWYYRALKNI